MIEMKNDTGSCGKWLVVSLIAWLVFISALATLGSGIYLMLGPKDFGGSHDIQRFAAIQCILGTLFLIVSIGMLARANWARFTFAVVSLGVAAFLCAAAARDSFAVTSEDGDTFFILVMAIFCSIPAFVCLSGRAKRHFRVGHN